MYEGWAINEVGCDEDANEEGLAIAHRGKELYKEKQKNSALNAKIITMDEYLGLRKSSEFTHLSSEEEAAMRRYEIESFYYEDVTEDLVDLDNDGKYRRQKWVDEDAVLSGITRRKPGIRWHGGGNRCRSRDSA